MAVQVQGQSISSGAATSITTPAITTTSGRLLHASIMHGNGGAQAPSIFNSITDTGNNTWLDANPDMLDANGIIYTMTKYANNIVSNTNHTVTINCTSTWMSLIIVEISGLQKTAPLDQAPNGWSSPQFFSTHTPTSGAFTTTSPNEVIIGNFYDNCSDIDTGWIAGAGYTIPANCTILRPLADSAQGIVQYKEVNAIQTGVTLTATVNTQTIPTSGIIMVTTYIIAPPRKRVCILA